ncbi:MAG: NAD-dependent dihydropyrimidine dehydrogenase subunit PreA [Bradymonadaceae bacterium]
MSEPDLSVNFAGIEAPNPFWLASAPPTNSGDQVMRAFEAGWGGAVWKTLGEPLTNVSSRFGAVDYGGENMVGFNNIELITDRPLEDNFREIEEVKEHYPEHAVIVSLMVDSREDWRDIIERSIDAGADGLELNFGCPHGMCERGMGSAVGQEPEVCEEITSWAAEFSDVPVIVKLTPNVTDIRPPARAAERGGGDAVSLINTIQSIVGVDLDEGVIEPKVDDKGTNGGYCGPAVRPIALHMVNQIAQDPDVSIPISGIGGIETWEDALEFIHLGAGSVQVCTSVMHHGFRIVKDMIDGTKRYLADKGFDSIEEVQGRALPSYEEWGDLDMNHEIVAKIDPDLCIGCQLCEVACHDAAHQCIHHDEDSRVPYVDEEECIGCNLCQYVCPVPDCIEMVEVDNGKPSMSWNEFQEAREQGEDVEHPGKSTHQTHF